MARRQERGTRKERQTVPGILLTLLCAFLSLSLYLIDRAGVLDPEIISLFIALAVVVAILVMARGP